MFVVRATVGKRMRVVQHVRRIARTKRRSKEVRVHNSPSRRGRIHERGRRDCSVVIIVTHTAPTDAATDTTMQITSTVAVPTELIAFMLYKARLFYSTSTHPSSTHASPLRPSHGNLANQGLLFALMLAVPTERYGA